MGMTRRRFLKHSATGALTACACCAGVGAALAEDTAQAPHWTYEGAEGPEHWGELKPDFKACQVGLEQTPPDLTGGIKAFLGKPPKVDFKKGPLAVVNNGHTAQINTPAGSSTVIDGVKYDLVQFHFHHPSEHLLSGKPFEMEVHFVHKSAAGNLAVLGVFVKLGRPNRAMEAIFAALPASEGESKGTDLVDPTHMLPARRGYFRYYGSLTTPPCSEGLVWTVFRDPITASKEQVEKFAKIFGNNARPAQKRNHRYLLEVSA